MGTAARKELRPALKRGAEPVRSDAADLFSRYDPKVARGYRVSVRARGVSVEQAQGRTTGLHPEFGALQMREALIPALEAKADEVVREVERMIDDAARGAGL